MSEKRTVKCPRCSYIWDTSSKMRYVPCPNCQRKFEVESHIVPSNMAKMEHFNLGEDGVKILDHNLHWIVDVYFKPKKVYCEYCKSSDCDHVKFALTLPDVQKILKERGWSQK